MELTKGGPMAFSIKSVFDVPDSGQSEATGKKMHRLNGILRFFLFAIVMTIILIALKEALSKLSGTAFLLQQAQAGTMTIPLLLIVDGLGFAAVIIFNFLAARIEKRPFGSFGLPANSVFMKQLVQGLAWGLLIASMDIGVTYLLGGLHFYGFALPLLEGFRYGFLWSLTFFIIALFEETLYRGYALHALSAALGFWPSAILLSALFGGLHLMNPGETLVGALDVMSYGLLACFTLRRTGSLWFAVGLHAAWDFSLTALYSVPGSGMQADGHLLRANLSGATWLTGGSDGPEGSAIGLAVLAASFVVFWVIFPAPAPQKEDLA